ncbi:MAG TPA: hypothetical protein VF590_00525 [Isosphaeraceae bacterium]
MGLCLHCGETKFGAICPCPACQVASTGDMELDIAFSDHHMAVATLQEFGEVVRAIRRVCQDDALRFWSFISFVSTHHPDVLRVELDPEERRRCDEILARADPPPVVVRDAGITEFLRKREEEGDDSSS